MLFFHLKLSDYYSTESSYKFRRHTTEPRNCRLMSEVYGRYYAVNQLVHCVLTSELD